MSEEFEKDAPSDETEHSMDMDAITAHLDRGWGLLSKGDLAAARVSAHHILQLDDESPEGHTLLGAIAAAEGDSQDAMDLFMRALDADPDYLDAMLYAAELAIHPLGDMALALRLCDDASELLEDDDPERLDVWLLRAEASFLGEGRETASALDTMPKPPYPDPTYYLRVGRICLDLGSTEVAQQLLREALEDERTRADAHYFLGVSEELAGSRPVALAHLLAAHELDLEQGTVPWALADDAFAACVQGAIERVAAPFGPQLAQLPLRIRPSAPIELVAEGFDPRAPIFLAGTTAPRSVEEERPASAPGASGGRRRRTGAMPAVSEAAVTVGTPTCLFVYKNTVERLVGNGNVEDLTDELFQSIAEEVAFFFGLDEAEAGRLIAGGTSVVEH